MKAFLIARVSTDDQADALPAQVYRLKDYALKMEYDFEVFEIKESAYKGDREKFNEVISRLFKIRETVALVFDKVDRYSRDVSSEEVRLLNTLTDNGKIELHFPSDHLVITQESSAGQRLMLSMNTAFSQYYSNSISDNVKRRNEQLRRDGVWTGKAPSGYRNSVKDGKKWIEIDPIESLAIKDAFDMYASGNSTLKNIQTYWDEKYGLIAPISGIDKILKNPFYYGIMRVKGNLYPHHYTSLVTEKVFNQCNDVRNGFKSKPRHTTGLEFPFRGMITCSKCGCFITFELKKNIYKYGRCTQFKGKHGATYVNETKLIAQMEKVFQKIIIPEAVCKDILELINKDRTTSNNDRNAKKAAVKTELNVYKRRIDKLYDDYVDKKIDETMYQRKSNEYGESIKKLETHLSTIELSDSATLETASHLLNVANAAYNIFKSGDYLEKRKILNKVLSNLQLENDQLRWKLKKPYELMAFCNDNSTWQGHVESNHDPRFWRPIY
jgi:site-specific DNA recombinase